MSVSRRLGAFNDASWMDGWRLLPSYLSDHIPFYIGTDQDVSFRSGECRRSASFAYFVRGFFFFCSRRNDRKSFSIVKRDILSWSLSSSVARRNGQGKGSETRYFQGTLLHLGMAARGAGADWLLRFACRRSGTVASRARFLVLDLREDIVLTSRSWRMYEVEARYWVSFKMP